MKSHLLITLLVGMSLGKTSQGETLWEKIFGGNQLTPLQRTTLKSLGKKPLFPNEYFPQHKAIPVTPTQDQPELIKDQDEIDRKKHQGQALRCVLCLALFGAIHSPSVQELTKNYAFPAAKALMSSLIKQIV